MPLRTKLLLLVGGVVLLGFAITLTALTRQAGALQRSTALHYAEELAARNAAQVEADLDEAMLAARTVSQALGVRQAGGRADRAAADALLKGVLGGNQRFLGVWTAWEPNAFDNRDAEFAGQAGHDATGRYIPYWNRGSGQLAVEPLVDYDRPGPGDYYLLARDGKVETLIEPYKYTVAGREVLITSTVAPIVVGGRVLGVAGVDIALSDLQQKVGAISIYGGGYASLLSNGGLYVGDRDAANVGKPSTGAHGDALAAVREGKPFEATAFHERLQSPATRIYVPVQVGSARDQGPDRRQRAARGGGHRPRRRDGQDDAGGGGHGGPRLAPAGRVSSASAEQSVGVAQVGEAVVQMDQTTQQTPRWSSRWPPPPAACSSRLTNSCARCRCSGWRTARRRPACRA